MPVERRRERSVCRIDEKLDEEIETAWATFSFRYLLKTFLGTPTRMKEMERTEKLGATRQIEAQWRVRISRTKRIVRKRRGQWPGHSANAFDSIVIVRVYRNKFPG